MSTKKLLFINTIILGVGKLTTQVSSFLLVPIYTLFLSPSEYGRLELILVYIGLVSPIVTLQLDRAAFRFIVENRNSNKDTQRVLSSSFFTVFIVSLIALVLASVISSILNLSNGLLIGVTFLAITLSNFFLQISRGLGENKAYAYSSAIIGISQIIFATLMILTVGINIQNILLITILAHTAGMLYLSIKLQIYKQIKLRYVSTSLVRQMASYSLPLVPSGVSWWSIQASDRTFISIFLGTAANGIYTVSNKYASIFMALYSIFDMSLVESASLNISRKDKDQFFSDVYNTSLKFFGSLALLMIAGFSIVSPFLLPEQYSESSLYFPILVVSAFFNSLVSSYSVVYIAKKLTNKVLSTSIIAALINIILNIILIQVIDLMGAAIASLIAFASMTALRYFDIQKYVTFKYNSKPIIGLLLSAVFVISLYYINIKPLNIVSSIYALTYSIILNRSALISTFNSYKIKLNF